ncbi:MULTISPECIES: acetate--CoA ligase family protein [Rhodococcus]|uniref:acetate--CoA ligase family protein n=1 Tax=Rhodococcus globerulus TaxID=33008 RepID=UPI001C56E6F9|nr:acetate--CoA ligase family protein [Rhodococcus globerulus]QXV99937.1 acetate--CoA ligase family protein [Rhodococcus globerulus]
MESTPITPERLRVAFTPESFAIIGASDKSNFSRLVHANLVAAGHEARTFLINPRSPEVHGRETHPTCASVGMSIDLAFVMVPASAAAQALRDAAGAGAKGVLVLSSGFAETGTQGQQRQRELCTVAEELGVVLIGPNVLGYVDVAAGIPAMALANPPQKPGNVALISQSGASCAAMKDFAALSGVGLSHVFTVGNEAMVTVGHLIDYLVEDDQVEAIAVFMEGIRQPEVFASAARRAAKAGKAVVVLKAGKSELAARSATAHTGALVGDNRVVDAVFARLGVIRVDTVEDMLVTAGFAAHTGPLERTGLGIVSISGGACDIIADLAHDAGVRIPELAEGTVREIAAAMPSYGHVQNPLDVTGAAIIDPRLFRTAVAAVGNDPEVGAVLVVNSLPLGDTGEDFYGQSLVDAIGAGLNGSKAPGSYLTQVTQPIGATARKSMGRGGVPHVIPGLRLGVDAFARVAHWSQRRARIGETDEAHDVVTRTADSASLSEVGARNLVESAGVPVVPAVHVHSATAAAEAVRQFGCPVAMKIVSADIAHKSDLGCVRLGVTEADADRVYSEILAAAAQPAANGAILDGVLVSPMRSGGIELLVGVTRDQDWGLMLAVALGGVLVEVLDDVALAPLPVTKDEARSLLESLRGAALLHGVRGGTPVDLDALAEVVHSVGCLAEELEPNLDSLEVNPLRVDGSTIEALDALVVWRDAN